MPNDSGLNFNYQYVLSSLTSGLQSFYNWFQQLAGGLFENSTINYLIIFLAAIFIIALIFFVFKLFFGLLKLATQIIIPVLLVLLVLFAVRLYSKINFFNSSAVVTVEAVDAKSKPFRNAETFFRLFEGNRVKVIGQTDDWFQIKRPDGKTGWINKAALGKILGS
jgi:hypothetical protein